MRLLAGLGAGAASLVVAAAVFAQAGPLNDLLALGQGSGQTPAQAEVQKPPGPPLEPTPRARCGPGSRPEPDVQGRVPAGSASEGLWCNVSLISHQGTSGGFKVLRYVDPSGHECAYYDTALLFPLNAFNLNASSEGVVVLDMADPAHPVQTDQLTELPMLSPHESLTLNERRGLVAAVNGNPSTYPGLVSIYSVREDCRHPVLQSTALVARFGHESGFAPDGKTFYATGTAVDAITAIDVTDPKDPHPIWHGNVRSHGMTLSDDGNRAYVADPNGRNMLILDTSEIQARKPNPQAREISRITWDRASIPQNAIPFESRGRPYVLEFDEYNAATLGSGSRDDVGAARIIDVSDERRPRIVSNLRLAVNQPEQHAAAGNDPGAINPAQGYAAHYCNIPTRVNPQLVACSFIVSGLRVFDIADVAAPREIAYFVAPTQPRTENGQAASDFAMSQPAFVPERHEVWFSDGTSGFYALRLADSVWPAAGAGGAAGGNARSCASRRRFAVRVRLPAGARGVRATLAGHRVRGLRRRGRTVRLTVDLRGSSARTAILLVRGRLRDGRSFTVRRVYHPCARRA